MWGIGDCIHQRAVLRALPKPIWLETTAPAIVHDLVGDNLKIIPHAGKQRIRENNQAPRDMVLIPANAERKRITYDPATIAQHGSILAAQFVSVGLKMPVRPDFSLPVPQRWRDQVKDILARNTTGKPVLVYRPICLNKLWECPARAPDPKVYHALFASIRRRFFVVSVCDLTQQEWIVGPPADADIKLHKGELSFEGLAGLFSQADMIFANPGFAPVLAQAVGTPVAIIYGGNEAFADTNAMGAHLAPTLAIEPDKPCACHKRFHKCDKRITIEPALRRLDEFVQTALTKPRTLIFATTYVDTRERQRLTEQWVTFHKERNPDCDLLLVDSRSPLQLPNDVEIFSFPDNIGHLSRNGPLGPRSGGRDGWGRAFCKGLELAIARGYEYAVHIEGDSLFQLPVMPIARRMQLESSDVLSVPVEGTKKKEIGWVETGLMFFRTGYVTETDFIGRYDWPNRKVHPTPERVIFSILGDKLKMMPWRAERGDKSHITVNNVHNLDWVTHCHDYAVYDRFIGGPQESLPVKVNLGCGKNRLDGWQNYDREVDVNKPLKFASGSIDYLLCEHCIEHIDYYRAIEFFKECRRVLKSGGVARFVVPSIEQIAKCEDKSYFEFTGQWQKLGPHARGAMHAILYAHGHKTAWTRSLMETTLFFAGFDKTTICEPHKSEHMELTDVEGHHRVIGDKFNSIESLVIEATA